ncbi:hypothetical protein AMTRI_Chr01g126980 [Amborella trichopoda]
MNHKSIIQAHYHDVLLPFELEFEIKLLLMRIDGEIQVRSNIDPTLYSLVGSGQSGGTTTAPLFLRIHTSYHCMDSYLSSTS